MIGLLGMSPEDAGLRGRAVRGYGASVCVDELPGVRALVVMRGRRWIDVPCVYRNDAIIPPDAPEDKGFDRPKDR
jgi:hypothetical protein